MNPTYLRFEPKYQGFLFAVHVKKAFIQSFTAYQSFLFL